MDGMDQNNAALPLVQGPAANAKWYTGETIA